MINQHWLICKQDNTIVFRLESCKDFLPNGNGAERYCRHCQHAQITESSLRTLLDTMEFKPRETCPNPCIFRGITTNTCLAIRGHTDKICQYGRDRQAELQPIERAT